MRKHISATAPALVAALAALGLLAAGCGGGPGEVAAGSPSPSESSSPSPGSPSPSTPQSPTDPKSPGGDGGADNDAKTELTIKVRAREGADTGDVEPATWTLTCSPAGGDHPAPEEACADLAEVGVKGFEPVPEDQMCTHIMGGPEVATVKGHVGGTEIDTEFDKAGGCELQRYKDMGAVLTP